MDYTTNFGMKLPKRGVDMVKVDDLNDNTEDIDTLIHQNRTMIAPAFDSTKAYVVGDPVVYFGELFVFIADKAAGAWDATKVEPTTAAEMGGGGTEVVANPSGSATAELTKIDIGGTKYNTNDATARTQLNNMKTGFDGVEYGSPAAMVQGCDTKLKNEIDLEKLMIDINAKNNRTLVAAKNLVVNVNGYTLIDGFAIEAGYDCYIYIKSDVNANMTINGNDGCYLGLGSNSYTILTSAQVASGYLWKKHIGISSASSRVYISCASGNTAAKISCYILICGDTQTETNATKILDNVVNHNKRLFGSNVLTTSSGGITVIDGFNVVSGHEYKIYVKSNRYIISNGTFQLGLGSNGNINVSFEDIYNGYVWKKTATTTATNSRVYYIINNFTTASNGIELYFSIEDVTDPSYTTEVDNTDTILTNPNMKYVGMYNGNKHQKFTIGFISDIHGDKGRFDRFVKLVNNVADVPGYSYFDLAVCGGDIIHFALSEVTNQLYNNIALGGYEWFNNCVSKIRIPFLTTTGNHDQGWGAGWNPDIVHSLTNAQVHDAYMIGSVLENNDKLPYGYYDNTTYKVRIISLYDFDSKIMEKASTYGWTQLPALRGAAKIYSQEQITWFASALNSVPSGYTVIVLTHTMPLYRSQYLESFLQWSAGNLDISAFDREAYPTQGYRNSDGGGMGIISDIIQAYIDKTTINETYSFQNSMFWTDTSLSQYWSDVTANFDFTNASGTFAFFLCGHFHADGAIKCTMSGYTSQKMIMVDTSSIENQLRISDLVRMYNTENEDCLMSIVLDTANRTAGIVKIGSSLDTNGNEKSHYSFTY